MLLKKHVLILVWVMLVLSGAVPTASADEATKSDAVKLKSIQFYSSGLASFGYSAKVEADAVLSFPVPQSEVSDAMRTISVDDPENGLKSILVRDAADLDTSEAFARKNKIDFSSRIDALLSLRGENIELSMESGRQLSGRLVSIENSLESLGSEMTERVRVSLLTEDGVESALLEEIRSFRCSSLKSQESLVQAARGLKDIQAQDDDSDLSHIEIHLSGNKSQDVSISFMQSMPVWKCSYVLHDQSLRMHVVVDNPTNQDWNDVVISITDGRPIAFEVDMQQHVRLSRPQQDLPLGIPGLPPIFSEQHKLPKSKTNDTAGASVGSGSFGGLGGRLGGMGGFGGFGSEDVGDEGSEPGSTILPYPTNLSLVVSAPQASNLQFARQASLEKQFEGSPLHLTFPRMTIPANSSGILASSLEDFEIEHRSVLAVDEKSNVTMAAINFENNSPFQLPPGPMTLRVDGRYQGEAMIQRTSSNSSRLIGFAVDTAVRVSELSPEFSSKIVEVTFDDESKRLVVRSARQHTRVFQVHNTSSKDKPSMVALKGKQGWKPENAEEIQDQGDSLWLTVNATAKQVTEKRVVLVQEFSESFSFDQIEQQMIKNLLQSQIADTAKARIREIRDRRLAIVKLHRGATRLIGEIKQRTDSIARYVEILSIEDLEATAKRDYAKRLEEQEKEIDVLQNRQDEIQTELEQHTQEIAPQSELGITIEMSADPFGESDGSDPFGK